MKVGIEWLREWTAPDTGVGELAHRLTMAGLEVSSVTPASESRLEGVVSARVVECAPHPDADKLSVCTVDTGSGTHTVVCGDPGVHAGQCAPYAPPGTELHGGQVIEAATIRGVESAGMLCSEAELGLSEEAEHLLTLPEDTTPGTPLYDLLGLADEILELELTPNRGDCLSILGVAREVAAIQGTALTQDPDRATSAVEAGTDDTLEVRIDDLQACSAYHGRIVKGVDVDRRSPLWMRERLRRAGIRPVNAVVDATAYVMLELGQPMHAFDLDRIRGPVEVRWGEGGETLELLDGTVAELRPDMLVIADADRAVALAGIMGGLDSAVSGMTRDIFLESACFAPRAVIGRARRLGLHTEASHRFERGVDPAMPPRALERVTRLIVDLAGGTPGPVTGAVRGGEHGLHKRPIQLRRARIGKLLGVAIDDDIVEEKLVRLGMGLKADAEGWQVTPPTHRYDIDIEADLIEEVARLHGYEHIPSSDARTSDRLHAAPETHVPMSRLRESLVQRGYHEVVTYSFVDPALQGALKLGHEPVELVNPISRDLGQMRTSLWPGLLACLDHNLKRQQDRVRVFETGLVFRRDAEGLVQNKHLAALAWGPRAPEQWGLPATRVDFHDLRGDLEALQAAGLAEDAYSFEAARHPALHPGQSARILRDGAPAGWIGTLHPALADELDLPYSPVLFEVEAGALTTGRMPRATPVSRYPSLRRDLALLVPEGLESATLLAGVRENAPEWLREVRIFDIYRGQGVEDGLKSVALGLILQESSRTLTDSEADEFVQGLTAHLEQTLGARIRD